MKRITPLISLALLALLLGAVVIPTVAQDGGDGPSDEILAQQLEPVILEQAVTPYSINTVVEFPVSQDTYIASKYPNTNFGLSANLRVGYNSTGSNYGALRAFIQFNISSIPSRAVINSATLQTYQHSATPAGDTPMGVVGRHLVSAWSETLVTWNSHQPDWGGVIGQGEIPSTLGWQTTNVTELIREWHNGTHANNGLLFIGDEGVQERQRYFYSLNANNGLYPRLVVDYTEYNDTTPPVASVNSLPQWSPSTFTVSWSGSDPGGSGIAYYDVQYNINGGTWTDWKMHATSTSAQFKGGQHNVIYQFRARAVDKAGNVQAFGGSQAQTRVDSEPPVVSVNALPEYTLEQVFGVSWSGSDSGSGVAHYDVQYRINDGPWENWLVNTTATSAQFTGAQDNSTYQFRARGTDNVGNVQPHSALAQAETFVNASGPISFVEPFDPSITRDDSFTVRWTGFTIPSLSIQYYDVWYRFGNGPWIVWLTQTTLTSTTFHLGGTADFPDGIYGFEARAMDSAGRLEAFTGVPDATMIVDRYPPYIEPRAYLPLVARAN